MFQRVVCMHRKELAQLPAPVPHPTSPLRAPSMAAPFEPARAPYMQGQYLAFWSAGSWATLLGQGVQVGACVLAADRLWLPLHQPLLQVQPSETPLRSRRGG